jgi:hypothetical protein
MKMKPRWFVEPLLNKTTQSAGFVKAGAIGSDEHNY